jgi:hypothetical protein
MSKSSVVETDPELEADEAAAAARLPAGQLEREWYTNPRPSPYRGRMQAHTEVLLRDLVDLIRDSVE